MRYVSIDVETTGLDPRLHSLIQVAMVIDDTTWWKTKAVEELPSGCTLVYPSDGVLKVDPKCPTLTSSLWQEYCGEVSVNCNQMPRSGTLSSEIMDFLWPWRDKQWDGRWTAAGKNFGGFDLPFLTAADPECKHIFHHRSIDPSVLLVRADDVCLPGLGECKRRAGVAGEVAHTALDDALDVIRVLRKVWVLGEEKEQ